MTLYCTIKWYVVVILFIPSKTSFVTAQEKNRRTGVLRKCHYFKCFLTLWISTEMLYRTFCFSKEAVVRVSLIIASALFRLWTTPPLHKWSLSSLHAMNRFLKVDQKKIHSSLLLLCHYTNDHFPVCTKTFFEKCVFHNWWKITRHRFCSV